MPPRDPRPRLSSRWPDPVALVWIGGAALGLLAYSVGPGRFLAQVLEAFQRAGWFLDNLVHGLTALTLNLVRAAAIGLFGTYVGLSVIGIRRTGAGRAGLVVVTLLFLLLVWGAEGDGHGDNARWTGALLLSAIAALTATSRLAR